MRVSSLFTLLLSTSLSLATPLGGLTGNQATLNDLKDDNLEVGIEKRSMNDIYRAALKENGTLRVAWGGDVQISKTYITKGFTTTFPGINIEIELDVSKYLDIGIDDAYEASNGTDDGVDVAVLQSVQNFPRWKEAGRLLPYKVAPWDDIYPEFVDEDGAYTGLHIFTLGFQVYNPNVTANTSLPTSFMDFLRPEWKDRLILTYPNDDDAVLFLFKGITEKYGFDFIHKLQEQKVRWVRGTATPSILIGNSNPHHDLDAAAQAKNARSTSFASSNAFTTGIATHKFDDEFMTWPQTGAIFKTTKMPETARLFLSFMMDDMWQARVSGGEFATRRKYDGSKILEQGSRAPANYVNFMSDRAEVEGFRFRIDKVIGPPIGGDPVLYW